MRRKNHGFSLIEILTVVVITAIITAFGGSMIAGSLDYYKTRRAAETLMWNLRSCQEYAKARGYGAQIGLKLFRGRVRDVDRSGTLDVDPTGFSYLTFRVPWNAVEPANTLGALTPTQRADVVNLPLGVTLSSTQAAQNDADGFIRSGIRFFFNPPIYILDGVSPTGILVRGGDNTFGSGNFTIDYRNGNYCALRSL